VHPDGKFGYVQPVSDRPESVSYDDTQFYGVGAFLLAATAMADLEPSSRFGPGGHNPTPAIGATMHKRDFMKAASRRGRVPGGRERRPAPPSRRRRRLDDRAYMAGLLERSPAPVLSAMSQGRLKATFPLELSPTWDGREKSVAYLECFGQA
jgi:hypothetical protein